MLGRALTAMLHRLAKLPAAERTPEQKAVLRELGLLYAALTPDNGANADSTKPAVPPQMHRNLEIMVRAPTFWNDHTLKVTVPEPPSTRICPICGADVP